MLILSDIYIASGVANELTPQFVAPGRLYLNDGKNNFIKTMAFRK
jgi:hypothetical protein